MDNGQQNPIQVATSMFQSLKQGVGNIGQDIGNFFNPPQPASPSGYHPISQDVMVPLGAPSPPQQVASPQQQIAPQVASPAPVTPQVSPQMPLSQDDNQMATNIKNGIMKWGGNTPLLDHIPALVQASKLMPKGVDPYLPVIMALRETQGGRDLNDPEKSKNLGANNIYNLTGTQPGNNKRFINYPDYETTILGGKNEQGGQDPGRVSHGFVGTILNSDDYKDFRQSGKMEDLFKHYSPTEDKNGSYDEQTKNYQFIRNYFNG